MPEGDTYTDVLILPREPDHGCNPSAAEPTLLNLSDREGYFACMSSIYPFSAMSRLLMSCRVMAERSLSSLAFACCSASSICWVYADVLCLPHQPLPALRPDPEPACLPRDRYISSSEIPYAARLFIHCFSSQNLEIL